MRSLSAGRLRLGTKNMALCMFTFLGDVQHVPGRSCSTTFFHRKRSQLFLADVTRWSLSLFCIMCLPADLHHDTAGHYSALQQISKYSGIVCQRNGILLLICGCIFSRIKHFFKNHFYLICHHKKTIIFIGKPEPGRKTAHGWSRFDRLRWNKTAEKRIA